MPNSFFTPTVVAKEFLKLLEPNFVLAKLVNKDYSDEFTMVGSSVKVRRQAQYLGQDNNLDLTSYTEDVVEGTATITMDQTWSNKVTIGAIDRTLSFDRWSDMVLKPMANRAAEKIETAIATAAYQTAYWWDGTPNTVPSTFLSLANVGAILDDANVTQMGRVGIHTPAATAILSDGLKGVFVQGIAKDALEAAKFGDYANATHYKSVFAPTHVAGVGTGSPTVNGAAQNVTYAAAKDTWTQSLVTTAWTASTANIVRAGDIITIAGVNAVNPSTKLSTGRLQTFVVTAAATSGAAGATTITISPPMITSGAYQTVDAAPANGAVITFKTGAGLTTRQSLIMDPSGVCLVTRPIDVPSGAGVKTHVERGNYVSVAVTEYTTGNTLDHNMRFDMLYKPVLLDPRKVARLNN